MVLSSFRSASGWTAFLTSVDEETGTGTDTTVDTATATIRSRAILGSSELALIRVQAMVKTGIMAQMDLGIMEAIEDTATVTSRTVTTIREAAHIPRDSKLHQQTALMS